MRLLELVRRESKISLRRLLVIAGIAGISNALVLALINSAAEQASQQQHSSQLLLLFVIVMAAYFTAQRHIMVTATSEVERILDGLRVRLADKIRRSDLLPLEHIGRPAIYASITRETTTISQSALMLILACQFAILVVFTALYVAWLSMTAFVLTAVITTLLAWLHLRNRPAFENDLKQSSSKENDLFESLTHFLEGFREVRINRARSNDLFDTFGTISRETKNLKIHAQSVISTTFITSQLSFYLLLGVIVFVVPRISATYGQEVVKTATAVLFLVGPISGLVSAVPNLAVADRAVLNIELLESRLDESVSRPSVIGPNLETFSRIEFERVLFQYDDAGGGNFVVGPFDLTIEQGEILFIAGGNGSGKSTFLKLLTALYPPQEGRILLDGEVVSHTDAESYRSLFSTVFTDYHLFDRLYGLGDVPQQEIERLLDWVELTGKTHVVDGRFDTLDLSGGQKKRLALLVSLLEDRPICVFDEVGADQDPAFRRKLYKEIFPELKRRGKTIVAVTHDDKYFRASDRLLKMDEGRFVAYDES